MMDGLETATILNSTIILYNRLLREHSRLTQQIQEGRDALQAMLQDIICTSKKPAVVYNAIMRQHTWAITDDEKVPQHILDALSMPE